MKILISNDDGYQAPGIVALHDALKTLDQPVMEVHLTNIHRREALYQQSIISLGATGVICGLGPLGYELALRAVSEHVKSTATT